MEPDCQALREAITFHNYILEENVPKNAAIIYTLAYLHLCLSSVLQGNDAKIEIQCAEEYLSQIYESDIFSHVFLQARIKMRKEEHKEAMQMLEKIAGEVTKDTDMGYVVINPIEYDLLDCRFVEVVKKVAQSAGVTFVPAAMLLQYTLTRLSRITGEQQKFDIMLETFEQILKNNEMDKEDRELGSCIFMTLQDAHQG